MNSCLAPVRYAEQQANRQQAGKRLVLDLDPAMRVKRTEGKMGSLPEGAVQHLESTLVASTVYWPGLRLRHIVVDPSLANLTRTESALGTIYLQPNAWQSPELLQFSLTCALMALQINQTIDYMLSDTEDIERTKENIARRDRNIQDRVPFSEICHNARSCAQRNPAVGPAMRDIIILLRSLLIFESIAKTPVQKKELLSQIRFYDTTLADFLDRACGEHINEQILHAAAALPHRAKLPQFIPEAALDEKLISTRPLSADSFASFATELTSLTEQETEGWGLPSFDMQPNSEGSRTLASWAGLLQGIDDAGISRQRAEFFRSLDLIAHAIIVNQKFPQMDFACIERLERLLGLDTLAQLGSWYGTAFAELIDKASRWPAFLDLLEAMGPDISRRVLTENLREVTEYMSYCQYLDTQTVKEGLHYLNSLAGKDAVCKAAVRSPEGFLHALYLAKEVCSVKFPFLPAVAEQLMMKITDGRIEKMFIRRPGGFLRFLKTFAGLAIVRDSQGELDEYLYSSVDFMEQREPLETLLDDGQDRGNLEWLVGFDSIGAELSARFGKEFVEGMVREHPMPALEIRAFLQSSVFSLADLDRVLDEYGMAEVRQVWERDPEFFIYGLAILRDFDVRLRDRLGAGTVVSTLSQGVSSFCDAWNSLGGYFKIAHLSGDQLDAPDRLQYLITCLMPRKRQGNAFGASHELLTQRMPWLSDETLRELFVRPEVLARLIHAATELCRDAEPEITEGMDGIDRLAQDILADLLSGKDEDEDDYDDEEVPAEEELFARSAWDEVVDLIGTEEMRALLSEAPEPFIVFIEKAAEYNARVSGLNLEALTELKTSVGKHAFVELIGTEPLFAADMLRRDKEYADHLVELAHSVWGERGVGENSCWLAQVPAIPPEVVVYAALFERKNPEPAAILAGVLKEQEGADREGVKMALQKDPKAILRLLRDDGTYTTVSPDIRGVLDLVVRIVGEEAALQALFQSPGRLQEAVGYITLDNVATIAEGKERLEQFFGWGAAEVGALFVEDPAGFVKMAETWQQQPTSRQQEIAQQVESWGSAGVQMRATAKSHVTTASLLLDALQQTELDATPEVFAQSSLLPCAHQRLSYAGRAGLDVASRFEEARMILEIADIGLGVNEAEALGLWNSLFIRCSLPVDKLNGFDVIRTAETNQEFTSFISGILLEQAPSSENFRQALGLAVQMPEVFNSAIAQADERREALLKEAAVPVVLEQVFGSLQQSAASQVTLSYLVDMLVLELLRLRRGQVIEQQFAAWPSERTSAEEARAITQSMEEVTAAGMLRRFQGLGITFSEPSELFERLSGDFLANIFIYTVDNFTGSSNNVINHFISNDSSFQDYLVDAIVGGIQSDERHQQQYRDALRLTLLVPEVARELLPMVRAASLTARQEQMFGADVVNALLENNFNRIVSSHADLVLAHDAGTGLVSLESKLERRAPLSVAGVHEMLAERGIDIDINSIASGVDPFLYRVWEGAFVPRLAILRKGYRGSRSFDDERARYVTHALSVAVRYGWEGGEVAKGEGERVVHQWDFPVLFEQIADLPVEEGAVKEFTVDELGTLLLKVEEGELSLSSLSGDTLEETIPITMPTEGAVRLVTVPRGDEREPWLFQVGKVDGHVYMMRIDRNVALANYFDKAPGPVAYVRQVSTEGQSDCEGMRKLVRMQVAERMLCEEILDAADKLERAANQPEATWAFNTIRAALRDLDPTVVKMDPEHVDVAFEQPYFDYTFGSLKETVGRIEDNLLTQRGLVKKKAISQVKSAILSCPAIHRLRDDEYALVGTFEAYDRSLTLDPYRSTIKNRRTAANRFIEMLRTHQNPSEMVRALFERGDLDYFLGEITALRGVEQGTRFHGGITAEEHTLRATEEMDKLIASSGRSHDLDSEQLQLRIQNPEELRLLALFHDAGKTEGRGHTEESARILCRFLATVECPAPITRRLSKLTRIHRVLGNIAASEVRRIAVEARQSALQDPGFQHRQQERIIQLAETLRQGVTQQEALEDLNNLLFLTAADASSIPFSESPTGNRWSPIFRSVLEDVHRRTAQAIEALDSLGPEAARQHITPNYPQYSL